MPTIADFTVIRDSGFEIKTGGDIDRSFTFSIASGAHLPSRSILAYVIDPETNARNLSLRVSINGTLVDQSTITGGTFRTIHEVVSGNVLRVGSNTIEFRIASGSGDLHIGDAVLWWQRTV